MVDLYSLNNADTRVRKTYGDVVDDVILVGAGDRVPGPVEDEDQFIFGDIPLSRNAKVCVSRGVDLRAIQTQRHQLNLAIPDKAGDVIGQPLGALVHCSILCSRARRLQKGWKCVVPSGTMLKCKATSHHFGCRYRKTFGV